MVQAKKSAAKKTTVKAKAAPRKAVVHKAPAKRTTSVRKVRSTGVAGLPSGGSYKSFKVGKTPKFVSFRMTDQTIYWAVLSFIVLSLGLWVVTINDKVQRMYDQIDAQNSDDSLVVPKKK